MIFNGACNRQTLLISFDCVANKTNKQIDSFTDSECVFNLYRISVDGPEIHAVGYGRTERNWTFDDNLVLYEQWTSNIEIEVVKKLQMTEKNKRAHISKQIFRTFGVINRYLTVNNRSLYI